MASTNHHGCKPPTTLPGPRVTLRVQLPPVATLAKSHPSHPCLLPLALAHLTAPGRVDQVPCCSSALPHVYCPLLTAPTSKPAAAILGAPAAAAPPQAVQMW